MTAAVWCSKASSVTGSDKLTSNRAYSGIARGDVANIPVVLQLHPPGTVTAAATVDKYGFMPPVYPVAVFSSGDPSNIPVALQLHPAGTAPAPAQTAAVNTYGCASNDQAFVTFDSDPKSFYFANTPRLNLNAPGAHVMCYHLLPQGRYKGTDADVAALSAPAGAAACDYSSGVVVMAL